MDTNYAHVRVMGAADNPHAYMALIEASNRALALSKAGELDAAEREYREVLRQKPQAGVDAVSIALTEHHLAEVLRRRGRLEEAEALLLKALDVRERHDEATGTSIALSDSNITRDELAKVYEAKGDCALALKTRVPGKRICGNGECNALTYEELQACSRCKCVFYCGKTCQRTDWTQRHRGLCQTQPHQQLEQQEQQQQSPP